MSALPKTKSHMVTGRDVDARGRPFDEGSKERLKNVGGELKNMT